MNKFSEKREAIFNCICSTESHPSAQWIFSRLKADFPDLSLATVYRNINLFKREKTVISVATVNGQERIDAKTEAHPHFICDSCGSIYDININLVDGEIVCEAEKKYGVKVQSFNLLLSGLREKCKKN